MKWQNRITDKELAEGNLNIVGNMNTSKLTEQNLDEIISAVQNGTKDYKKQHHSVRQLTLSQISLPKKATVFQNFINKLLAIPHLKVIDFGVFSTFSMVLNKDQISHLAITLPSSNISTLKFKVQDSAEAAKAIATMIQNSPKLENLTCDLTDDAYQYAVVKSAIGTNNQLKTLNLSATAKPFALTTAGWKVTNCNLEIKFEGGSTLNTRLLTESKAESNAQSNNNSSSSNSNINNNNSIINNNAVLFPPKRPINNNAGEEKSVKNTKEDSANKRVKYN